MNFQPASAAVPAHNYADVGMPFTHRSDGLAIGWNGNTAANAVARNSARSPDARYDTFIQMQFDGNWSWSIALPDGQYKVLVVAGDADSIRATYKIHVNGVLAVDGKPTAANHWVQGTSDVAVADGELTISNARGAHHNKLCFVEISSIASPSPAPQNLSWSSVKSSPQARFEGGGIVVDGNLYCFGGYDNSAYKPITAVNEYDTQTNTWTTKKSLPVGMTEMGLATDGQFIYLAGGYIPKSPKGQTFATTSVLRYDPATDSYTKLQSLPVARGVGSMVYLDGKLYYMGGSDINRNDVSTMYVLDLNSPGAKWVQLASMPAARNRFGAVALDGQIYAVGGQTSFDNNAVYHSNVYRYDPASNVWTTVESMSGPARSHIESSTIVADGRIMVLGGEGAGRAPLSTVSMYDPSKDSWSSLPSLPAARNGGIAATIGNEIIFTSGLNGTFQSHTWLGKLS